MREQLVQKIIAGSTLLKSREWLLALIVASIVTVSGHAGTLKKQKNVVLIIADDLNNKLPCYGATEVLAPNLDRLADRSVVFHRAYSQIPKCEGSRASFLSGLYPWANGLYVKANGPERQAMPSRIFLPQWFLLNGYETVGMGKIFHAGYSSSLSQDQSVSWTRWGGFGTPLPSNAPTRAVRNYGSTYITREYDVGDWEPIDGSRMSRAIQELDGLANGDDPFFLAVGLWLPHTPWGAPSRFFDLYDPDQLPLPEEPPNSQQGYPNWSPLPHWVQPVSEAETRSRRRDYFACISYVDFLVGALLDRLDALALWDDTIVVFMGDHGYSLGEHNGVMWSKWNAFEEAIRTPLMIAAPGYAAGNCHRVVELVDLFSTLNSLTGIPQPDQIMHGRDLSPLISQPDLAWPYPSLTSVKQQWPNWQVVRTESWKYARCQTSLRMLIDVVEDPQELHNLGNLDPDVLAAVQPGLEDLFPPEWSSALEVGHDWTTGTTPDRDGDGLEDHAELEFGSWPHRADTDEDGLPDNAEFDLGFDPVVNESNRVAAVQDYAALFGLVAEESIQEIGSDFVVRRDAGTGQLRLQVDVDHSVDLDTWTPLTSIDVELPAGEGIEFFRYWTSPSPASTP